MNVKLVLDPKLVWRLEAAAEKAGVSFGEYAELILRGGAVAARGRSARVDAAEVTRGRVRELHAAGLTDVEIAVEVDRVQEHVARLRRGMGLKSNRPVRVAA